jgi:hypothetical protein
VAPSASPRSPLEVLWTLPVMPTVAIWCDNDDTVQCGNGVWKRRKNMDLWAVYDEVLGDVMCRSGRSRHL